MIEGSNVKGVRQLSGCNFGISPKSDQNFLDFMKTRDFELNCWHEIVELQWSLLLGRALLLVQLKVSFDSIIACWLIYTELKFASRLSLSHIYAPNVEIFVVNTEVFVGICQEDTKHLLYSWPVRLRLPTTKL